MRLATIFQSGAVLQRDRIIPVWGWTRPQTMITGKLDSSEAFCRSAADGFFMLYFPEHTAGGPFTMEVSDGVDSVTLTDILVGEVWLASGQSNMAYRLNSDLRNDKSDPEPLSRRQEQEFKSYIKQPRICRFINLPLLATSCRESSFEGAWLPMTREHAGDCSAVAAWFAADLQHNLDVPIGIINSSWGGTIAEAWMSESALLSNPYTRSRIMNRRLSHELMKNYQASDSCDRNKILAENLRPDGENEGLKLGYHLPELDDSQWREMIVPGSWISQKISNNGAVWIRKRVSIPANWLGKDLIFAAGTIDKQDITYVNGTEVGRTGSGVSLTTWDVQRKYPVQAELIKDCEVLLAIRAYSFGFDGNFLGKRELICPELNESIEITGSWKIIVELDIGRISPKDTPIFYGPGYPNTPAILFDSMIRPLLPAAIAGVIWYQGESNAQSLEDSINYYSVLKSLIDDWRYAFQYPEMPFIMVQLANFNKYSVYDGDSLWAPLRESQRTLCRDHKFTYMASAIDLGESDDIHPQDKKSVGTRLAAAALSKVYNLTGGLPGGPEIRNIERCGNQIVLTFDQADGLVLHSGCDQSFYLSDDGTNFAAAESAEVCGNQVKLTTADARKIRFVRYAWSDNPASSLYNEAGSPASSFCAEVK